MHRSDAGQHALADNFAEPAKIEIEDRNQTPGRNPQPGLFGVRRRLSRSLGSKAFVLYELPVSHLESMSPGPSLSVTQAK